MRAEYVFLTNKVSKGQLYFWAHKHLITYKNAIIKHLGHEYLQYIYFTSFYNIATLYSSSQSNHEQLCMQLAASFTLHATNPAPTNIYSRQPICLFGFCMPLPTRITSQSSASPAAGSRKSNCLQPAALRKRTQLLGSPEYTRREVVVINFMIKKFT